LYKKPRIQESMNPRPQEPKAQGTQELEFGFVLYFYLLDRINPLGAGRIYRVIIIVDCFLHLMASFS
jgi:hypothetical protein